jgi:hypothetical protein
MMTDARVGGCAAAGDGKKLLQSMVEEAKSAGGLATDSEKSIKHGLRQTLLKGAAAIRIDMDTKAEQPIRRRAIALVNGTANSGFLQPMCQAQPANSATDDYNFQIVLPCESMLG